MKFKLLVSIAFLVILIGCTFNPSPTITPLPNTQTPTVVPAFTLTPAHISEPTPAIISTFPIEEARIRLLELLSNNGNCRLPCLWGFTPGESNLEKLKNTLSQFGQIYSQQNFYSEFSWNNQTGGISFGFTDKNIEVIGEFGHTKSPRNETLTLHAVGPRFETPNSFSPLVERFEYYLLPQILSNYSQPSEVIVGPYPFDPDRPNDWLPMNLGLFYPDQGFYIEYVMTKLTKGKYFVSCPAQPVEISIVVWNATEPKSLLDIAKLYPPFWGINENNLNEYYRSIGQALSMTSGEFYQKFRNASPTDCIMAPISLWPYQ
jgi:hypothetical protein